MTKKFTEIEKEEWDPYFYPFYLEKYMGDETVKDVDAKAEFVHTADRVLDSFNITNLYFKEKGIEEKFGDRIDICKEIKKQVLECWDDANSMVNNSLGADHNFCCVENYAYWTVKENSDVAVDVAVAKALDKYSDLLFGLEEWKMENETAGKIFNNMIDYKLQNSDFSAVPDERKYFAQFHKDNPAKLNGEDSFALKHWGDMSDAATYICKRCLDASIDNFGDDCYYLIEGNFDVVQNILHWVALENERKVFADNEYFKPAEADKRLLRGIVYAAYEESINDLPDNRESRDSKVCCRAQKAMREYAAEGCMYAVLEADHARFCHEEPDYEAWKDFTKEANAYCFAIDCITPYFKNVELMSAIDKDLSQFEKIVDVERDMIDRTEKGEHLTSGDIEVAHKKAFGNILKHAKEEGYER